MTTEDMIKQIYDFSYEYYKQSRNCPEGIKLDRHEPVELEGQIFTCWKEFVMFRVAEYIQSKIPYASVEVTLDGNNSNIDLTCSDKEQAELNQKMYSLIKEVKTMRGIA